MQFAIKTLIRSILFCSALAAGSAFAAEVYFISPADGEVFESPVLVQFGLRDMGVTAAGFDAPNTGHHHLLVDMDELPDMTMPLPKTEQLLHFGGGQTETVLQLPPGKHTLQLIVGNHLHIPGTPPVMSEKITIEVRCAPKAPDEQAEASNE
jgi:hypothetical protein